MRLTNKPYLVVLILCLIAGCKQESGNTAHVVHKWQQYRGVNIGCDINEEDLRHLAASGANLVRYSAPVCTLIDLEPPFHASEEGFAKLDSVINWSEKHNLSVLIDPHRYPGTEHQWTMLGTDPFWKDFKYHEATITLWKKIAARYKDRGEVIAGYDLLNEPQFETDFKEGTPQDLNLLYSKITEAIRETDSVHTIVYALPRVYDAEADTLLGYHIGINYLKIPDDGNIALETHTYMPQAFTHQNIWEDGPYVAYPLTDGEITWNKAQLEHDQRDLIAFSKKNPTIPVFVGEFSSPRWTGKDGIQYLTDVIEIAEENNWSWAYHAYREDPVWDPEMSVDDRNDNIRRPDAPRWELLNSYFSKNRK